MQAIHDRRQKLISAFGVATLSMPPEEGVHVNYQTEAARQLLTRGSLPHVPQDELV